MTLVIRTRFPFPRTSTTGCGQRPLPWWDSSAACASPSNGCGARGIRRARRVNPGEATVGGRRLDLAAASAYHDHNWGRWHWGDDLGWDWGAFLTPAPGPAIVLVRTTNREHTESDLRSFLTWVC